MKSMDKSIVVLSGGQDSVTCLYKALKESDVKMAVHFDYGQRHKVERECAEWHTKATGVPLTVLEIPALAEIKGSALVGDGDVNAPHAASPDLPASYVPCRNLILLTLAAAVAIKIGALKVYTGVCVTDYSGYPDCRDETIKSLQQSIRLGTETAIELITPLMWKTKAETFQMASELRVLGDVIEHTHTCYEGDRSKRWEWGYGCGVCAACQIRRNGWNEFTKDHKERP